VSINVGPWVLSLASLYNTVSGCQMPDSVRPYLEEDIWDNIVDLADELEHRILREMLKRKLALGSVAGVRLAENGVTVSGDNLAALESRPDIFLNCIIAGILADLGLHPAQPDQDFLVGKTVEGPGETVEGGSESQERVRKRRANKLSSVSRDITALVITARIRIVTFPRCEHDVPVNGDVEAEKLNKGLVIAETKKGSKVPRVIFVSINGGKLALAVDILVDTASNIRELGDPVTVFNRDVRLKAHFTLTSPCSLRRRVPNTHAC
jgi:hypothetical protein